MSAPIPLEELLSTQTTARQVVIGLPAPANISDHRFPLTPEGAALLIERGFKVVMEEGAAVHIHYPDGAYSSRGVEVVKRSEALQADIVIYLPALTTADARALKRGALLLTFLHNGEDDRETLRILLRRHIIALGLEMLTDNHGNHPFVDILQEIAGRAAIAVASSLLADAIHGKGILLGGVAGIVPCEVMIIGSDMAAVAAAQSAIGLGATVKMFDNNTYRLREAIRALGPGVIGSSVHPKVFQSALRSADIVIATDGDNRLTTVDSVLMDTMKKGVVCFDLSPAAGKAFPAMQVIDLDLASASDTDPSSPTRLCYINAGNAVPRTIAMALSNCFATMLDELLVCDGVANALNLNENLRRATFIFLGKCVNRDVATALGERWVDINLFLQFS